MSADLAALRAENEAAWRRDIYLSDYERVVLTSCSRYLPALEAEVERQRAEIERLIAQLTDCHQAAMFRVDL